MAKSKPDQESKQEPVLEEVSVVEAAAEVDAVIEPAPVGGAWSGRMGELNVPLEDEPEAPTEDDFSREPSLLETLEIAFTDLEDDVRSLKKGCVQLERIILLVSKESPDDVAVQQRLFQLRERLDKLNGI